MLNLCRGPRCWLCGRIGVCVRCGSTHAERDRHKYTTLSERESVNCNAFAFYCVYNVPPRTDMFWYVGWALCHHHHHAVRIYICCIVCIVCRTECTNSFEFQKIRTTRHKLRIYAIRNGVVPYIKSELRAIQGFQTNVGPEMSM